jgi:nicotinamide riboside transporter PnuC
MNITYWTLALVATIGCLLNNWQRKEGFYLWMLTNLFWAAIYYRQRQYAQSYQFAVQALFAVHGLVKWTRMDNTERREIWLDWKAMQKWDFTRPRRQRFSI